MKILEAGEKDIPLLIALNNEVQKLHINGYPEKYKKLIKVKLMNGSEV